MLPASLYLPFYLNHWIPSIKRTPLTIQPCNNHSLKHPSIPSRSLSHGTNNLLLRNSSSSQTQHSKPTNNSLNNNSSNNPTTQSPFRNNSNHSKPSNQARQRSRRLSQARNRSSVVSILKRHKTTPSRLLHRYSHIVKLPRNKLAVTEPRRMLARRRRVVGG